MTVLEKIPFWSKLNWLQLQLGRLHLDIDKRVHRILREPTISARPGSKRDAEIHAHPADDDNVQGLPRRPARAPRLGRLCRLVRDGLPVLARQRPARQGRRRLPEAAGGLQRDFPHDWRAAAGL